jgi:hypothetical protein
VVSHSKHFVFVHIPRTAGTSIEAAFHRYGIALQGPRNYESIYFKHASAADLQKMMGDEFTAYYKFAVVRNPYSWVVSNYEFNRGLHRCWTRSTPFDRIRFRRSFVTGMDFPEWIGWWLHNLRPSQSRMVVDRLGALLIDRHLAFERLDTHFRGLCRQLAIKPRRLPHLMPKTADEAYVNYFDSRSARLVRTALKEDFDRFGYSARLR